MNHPAAPDRSGFFDLEAYGQQVGRGDLYGDANPSVKAKWQTLAQGLGALVQQSGHSAQDLIGRQVQDLGLSFRVTGEKDERSWPLSPMPLLIGSDEWSRVEEGLAQRAELLERVIADIYGPQTLIREGHIPAALITGSRYYARLRAQQSLKPTHNISVYAVDVAREPCGQWRILSDRVRLANGLGYALENRLAMARTTGTLLSDLFVRRISGFFGDVRHGLVRHAMRENPRLALLTPGRFNQSYPEQAHLARYMGFPLVEGRDLFVAADKLFVRTIAGPKRIDAVWRWLDTKALDPLHFNSRSSIGVPDIYGAWAAGGVEMANAPGAEVVESPAMSAYLPRLSRLLVGADLQIPNIPTHWGGVAASAAHVRDNWDNLILTPAFGDPHSAVVIHRMSVEEKARLQTKFARRPMDYCGQEIISLSTTPVLKGDQFQPQPFILRAFLVRSAQGAWSVMPGGFVRLSATGRAHISLLGEKDVSADCCVVDTAAPVGPQPPLLLQIPTVRRGGTILASQAADNLYWLGRYAERLETTVRLIRALLDSMMDVGVSREGVARTLLAEQLFSWSAIRKADRDLPTAQLAQRALAQDNPSGTVSHQFTLLRDVGMTLRERFTPDFWRLVQTPLPDFSSAQPVVLQHATNQLVERFSAMSGLVAENMMRGPIWQFLDLGRRLERALALCQLARNLGVENTGALWALLDICAGQLTYRTRYLAQPMRALVLDLLILDGENPRSLIYQLQSLVRHIENLPSLRDDKLPEAPLLHARRALAHLAGLSIETLDNVVLSETEAALMALSDQISARYFLQLDKVDIPHQGWLA